MSQAWKLTSVLKGDTSPASFIIYHGLENVLLWIAPTAFLFLCGICHNIYIMSPLRNLQFLIQLLHNTLFELVFIRVAIRVRHGCTAVFPQWINALWWVTCVIFKLTFEAQGTTYPAPFSLSRLCLLSNRVGASQWLLVIQGKTGCHYTFVWNLGSYWVLWVSCQWVPNEIIVRARPSVPSLSHAKPRNYMGIAIINADSDIWLNC